MDEEFLRSLKLFDPVWVLEDRAAEAHSKDNFP